MSVSWSRNEITVMINLPAAHDGDISLRARVISGAIRPATRDGLQDAHRPRAGFIRNFSLALRNPCATHGEYIGSQTADAIIGRS